MSAKIWKGCPAWEHTRANVVRIRDTATMIASSILRLGTDRAAQILHPVRLQLRIDVGQDSFLLSSMTAEPMEAVPPSMRQGLRHG